MPEGIESSALGQTDAGADRDRHDRADAPPAPRCKFCNLLIGSWSRVHFVNALDMKPCEGSWK